MNASRTTRSAGLGIATKLLLSFLAIALIPCAVLTAVTTYLSRRALERSARDRLQSIAEAKATQVESFVRERRGDAVILGTTPGVADAATTLTKAASEGKTDTAEYARLADPFRPLLAHFVDIYDYGNIHLFGLDGTLLLSHRPEFDAGTNLRTGPLKGTELADSFERAGTLFQSVLSDYQLYPGRKHPTAFIAGPVFREGVAVGVIVFEFNNNEVFKVFRDFSGLGASGEATVAMRTGDELVYVAPTRHDPEAAFRRRFRTGSPERRGMQQAVQGKRGYGATTDYRGTAVMGAWSYLPSFRWGMIVKQDADEAFALVADLRRVQAALLGATVLVVVALAIAQARAFSRPIQAASRAARAVAAGDLTEQVAIRAAGEPGQLLDAVRIMTRDLRALIGRIQQSSVALMSTATEIAATSKQQEQVVLDYGSSTNQAAAAVKQISATGQELLRTMTEVNDVAGQTAALASAGQDGLTGMERTMRLLADSTGSIGAKLAVISERAAHINLAVTTITKVADQTNLLSINAAIEAEKAGEYGLGFLVVAREIRRLADQSAVATLDIERMVKEMQSSVAAGVMEMDKFRDQVRHGVDEVGLINEQFGQILHAVRGLTDRFDQVTEGMRVQAQGADQIREAVVRINEGANQTSVSLKEFNLATVHLREAVGGLKEEIAHFRLGDAPTTPE